MLEYGLDLRPILNLGLGPDQPRTQSGAGVRDGQVWSPAQGPALRATPAWLESEQGWNPGQSALERQPDQG